MASQLFFAGRLYTTPAAVSSVSDSAMAPTNPATGNNLAIIGTSDGGQPQTLLTFSSPLAAAQTLLSGPLLTAVYKAFAPSADTGSPATVTVVRVEDATTSSLTLLDASSNPAITLASQLYGVLANAVKVEVQAGSITGLQVTTQYQQTYYTADNLAQTSFSLQYTGNATTSAMTLTPTTLSLNNGTTASSVVSVPTTGLAVGMTVSGPGVPASDTISAVTNATTLALTAAAIGTGIPAGASLTFASTVVTTAASTSSTTLAVPTTGLTVGMAASGPGIAAGATIASITSSTALVLSLASTVASGASVTFSTTATTTAATVGPLVASISLAAAATVQGLVDQINAISGFTATPTVGQELVSCVGTLDGYTAQDVKTAAFTVTSNLQAVINWLNSGAQQLVTATRPAAAIKPPAVIPFTFLSGAVTPAPIMSDWTNALGLLQSADVQWLAALSGSAAVWAAVDAHVQFMSTAGRKERRAVVGGAIGTTLAEALAVPVTLNSDRTAFAWPGHYGYDTSGNLTLFDSFYTAVMIAAGMAAMNPGRSMTNKSLPVQGLEYVPQDPVQTDQLILAGVCAVESSIRGFTVCRAISTWLENDNYNRVEMSCGAAADFVVHSVRTRLAAMIGDRATPQALSQAAQITESVLMAMAVVPPAGPGVIVGDVKSPAYSNINATLSGDTLNVTFQCSPVIPLNFITLGVSLVPYSGSISV